jgi:hypothetical protein
MDLGTCCYWGDNHCDQLVTQFIKCQWSNEPVFLCYCKIHALNHLPTTGMYEYEYITREEYICAMVNREIKCQT